MIILTCANIDVAPKEFGQWYNGFSFKKVIQATMKKAIECDYTPVVYDLGNLGIGEFFNVEDETFRTKGYFSKVIKKGYKSRSLFKPDVVKYCLNKYNQFTVYLDGDAQLLRSIDEVNSGDYDVGVTLRKSSELKTEWHKELFDIAKFVNAGVIFFNPTKATKKFIKLWEQKTQELGNDQMALNQLVCPDFYPVENSILKMNDIRIKFFPCEKYNYYYFEEGMTSGIKIMHFKGLYRKYFPFTWEKYLYCLIIPPLINIGQNLIKKSRIATKLQ